MGKRLLALFSLALLIAILPGAADEWNKKTIVKFSQAVELPGVVLPAGTYVFNFWIRCPTATLCRYSTKTKPRYSQRFWPFPTID